MARGPHRKTLTQFLIDERRRFPSASGDFNGLILDVASTCKSIARAVAYGHLEDLHRDESTSPVNVHGELHKTLDVQSHEAFVRFNQESETLAGLASELLPHPVQIPQQFPRGKYLLLYDPLDRSSNLDVNAPVGSIFSVLRAPDPGREASEADFLQPGRTQVAAGYALYGAATLFVLSVGNGVHGFTLDRSLGDFLLTHPGMRVPDEAEEFAINASNSRFWESPVKRYVNECLRGTTGPRGKDFSMRWIASLVADAHRVLVRGGVFLHPRDSRVPSAGLLRLLYEANPLAFLIEQAGGRASTGSEAVLGLVPSALHQGIGLVFGSRSEVERIEHYHAEPHTPQSGDPLFAERGLFRD